MVLVQLPWIGCIVIASTFVLVSRVIGLHEVERDVQLRLSPDHSGVFLSASAADVVLKETGVPQVCNLVGSKSGTLFQLSFLRKTRFQNTPGNFW